MEKFLFFVIAVLLVQQAIATDKKIAPICTQKYEEYKSCGSACPPSCKDKEPAFCTDQCVPGCYCKKGYVRNDADGSCCLPRECPVTPQICPSNEIFNSCGTTCPLTCANYKNAPLMCTKDCKVGCECMKGYVRNDADGSCCLPCDCPVIQPVCPLHETYNSCGSSCPVTCKNFNNPPKYCTMDCKVGCECEEGYVRNEDDGFCCLPSDCPVIQPVCPLHEIYNYCGSSCPRTCNNYKNQSMICTADCKEGCECEEGYVRNEDDDSCCLPSDCPAPKPTCLFDKFYKSCGPVTVAIIFNLDSCTPDVHSNIGCECKKG